MARERQREREREGKINRIDSKGVNYHIKPTKFFKFSEIKLYVKFIYDKYGNLKWKKNKNITREQ